MRMNAACGFKFEKGRSGHVSYWHTGCVLDRSGRLVRDHIKNHYDIVTTQG